MTLFSIAPLGPYSLRESVEFGFGQRHAETFDGSMRMTFCVDGDGYYGLGHDATPDEFRDIAENWRPFRTWATVLLRAAGKRIAE